MSQRQEYFKGASPCSNCRKSNRFYIQDGLTYCKRCDFQQEVATQTEIPAEASQQIRQTTRKQKETVEKVSRIYRGANARELYLQAFQLILWKQCTAFVRLMTLSEEFEHVVKNLWALRLQLLKTKVDAVSDDETEFSSQPQFDESETEDDRKLHRRKMAKFMPSIMDSLGICYLAMMLLRLPISVGEIHRWVMREDITFIRALRFIPTMIKQKLPAHYLRALDTLSVPELDQIREAIENIRRFYTLHFAIVLPPLNAPLVLFKHIRHLALPLNIIPVVLRLAARLSIDFNFHRSGRQRTFSFPETSLMSLLVIAVKLHHPFDDVPRAADSFEDPAILRIKWPKWAEAYNDHTSRIQAGSGLVQGSEIHVCEEDVMKMSGDQMDTYLNWYERTFVDEERARTKFRPLHEDFRRWFPTTGYGDPPPAAPDPVEQLMHETQSAEQFSIDVMQAMQMQNVTPETETETEDSQAKIGSRYRRYRTYEDLTGEALTFHETAATAAGMKLETLLLAIIQLEQSLLRTRTKRSSQRKGKAPADPSHLTAQSVPEDDLVSISSASDTE